MSIKVFDIMTFLDGIAPCELKETWDNVGLLCGNGDTEVTGVLFALDITSKVIDEAVTRGDNLIISHHPVIFKPLITVTASGSGCLVYSIIRNNLSAICMHTNLDTAKGGVNDVLAGKIGLKDVEGFSPFEVENYYKIIVFAPESHAVFVRDAMAKAGAGTFSGYTGCAFTVKGEGFFLPEKGSNPAIGTPGVYERVKEISVEMLCHESRLDNVVNAMRKAHPYEVPAFDVFKNLAPVFPHFKGRIGNLESPLSPEDFAKTLCKKLNIKAVRMTAGKKRIKRVAVMGGSGSQYFAEGLKAKADAFVTADVKYHDFLAAEEMGLTLIDAGHYHTENIVIPHLLKKVKNAFPNLPCCLSASGKSPYEWTVSDIV